MLDNDRIIRRLREENDTQREYIRQLEEALSPSIQTPSEWGMTFLEIKLFSAIRAARFNHLSRNRAMLTLFGTTDDLPDTNIIDVLIANIRRRLRKVGCGVVIECWKGRGWRMPPESCAIFDAAVAAEQARWPALKSAA